MPGPTAPAVPTKGTNVTVDRVSTRIDRLLDERESRIGSWHPTDLDVLRDFAQDPNRYLFAMAQDIEVGHDITLLEAVCAVHPYFPVPQRATRPTYRGWSWVPAPDLLARALHYAVHPPARQVVAAAELRHGDVLPGSATARRVRVHNPVVAATRVSYTTVPLAEPTRRTTETAEPAEPVERELREAETPATVAWDTELAAGRRPPEGRAAVALVEVHVDEDDAAAVVAEFLARGGHDMAILPPDSVVPDLWCRHHHRLVPVGPNRRTL